MLVLEGAGCPEGHQEPEPMGKCLYGGQGGPPNQRVCVNATRWQSGQEKKGPAAEPALQACPWSPEGVLATHFWGGRVSRKIKVLKICSPYLEFMANGKAEAL